MLEDRASREGLLCLTGEELRSVKRTASISEVYSVEDTVFARGKFATVRRASHKTTGVQYAAKYIKKRRRAIDMTPEIYHEICVLLNCASSSRVVRLHEVYETNSDVVLVLEMAAGGELQRIFDSDHCLTEIEARRAMRQILEGLCYLHEKNIAHLDLKPQNLLLTVEDCCDDIKLCDFGVSRLLEPGTEVRALLGTPDYVAPEVLSYEPISLATDIWSAGVLAYVLLSGFTPFGAETKQQTYLNISQCLLTFEPDHFVDVSSAAMDFIKSALVVNPRNRPTVQDLLQHQWISPKTHILPPLMLKSPADVITTSTTTPKTTPLSQHLLTSHEDTYIHLRKVFAPDIFGSDYFIMRSAKTRHKTEPCVNEDEILKGWRNRPRKSGSEGFIFNNPGSAPNVNIIEKVCQNFNHIDDYSNHDTGSENTVGEEEEVDNSSASILNINEKYELDVALVNCSKDVEIESIIDENSSDKELNTIGDDIVDCSRLSCVTSTQIEREEAVDEAVNIDNKEDTTDNNRIVEHMVVPVDADIVDCNIAQTSDLNNNGENIKHEIEVLSTNTINIESKNTVEEKIDNSDSNVIDITEEHKLDTSLIDCQKDIEIELIINVSVNNTQANKPEEFTSDKELNTDGDDIVDEHKLFNINSIHIEREDTVDEASNINNNEDSNTDRRSVEHPVLPVHDDIVDFYIKQTSDLNNNGENIKHKIEVSSTNTINIESKNTAEEKVDNSDSKLIDTTEEHNLDTSLIDCLKDIEIELIIDESVNNMHANKPNEYTSDKELNTNGDDIVDENKLFNINSIHIEREDTIDEASNINNNEDSNTDRRIVEHRVLPVNADIVDSYIAQTSDFNNNGENTRHEIEVFSTTVKDNILGEAMNNLNASIVDEHPDNILNAYAIDRVHCRADITTHYRYIKN